MTETLPQHRKARFEFRILVIRACFEFRYSDFEFGTLSGCLSVRKSFPTFRDPPQGHWAHGMQQRNIRNLWRILAEDPNAPESPQPASAPVHSH